MNRKSKMIMKQKFILLAATLLLLTDAAIAQTLNLNYGYVSLRGNGATNAEVIFPANTDAIFRLTSYEVTNDTAAAILKLQAGTYGATISSNAASSSTNCTVLGNSYIVANDTVVFQKADNTTFSATVSSTNGTTINLTGQLGTALAAGDKVYRMGILHTNLVGSATVKKDGPCIFAAPLRQPMRLLTYGNTTITAISSASGFYDKAAPQ
jgi:hypothetical protein